MSDIGKMSKATYYFSKISNVSLIRFNLLCNSCVIILRSPFFWYSFYQKCQYHDMTHIFYDHHMHFMNRGSSWMNNTKRGLKVFWAFSQGFSIADSWHPSRIRVLEFFRESGYIFLQKNLFLILYCVAWSYQFFLVFTYHFSLRDGNILAISFIINSAQHECRNSYLSQDWWVNK